MNATDSQPQRPLPPPPPPMKLTASHKVLWALVILLIVAKLIEVLVHVPFHSAAQQAVFGWKLLAFFVALLLLGSGFAHIIGFAGMWEKNLGLRQKIWAPLAIGIVLGIALLVADHSSGFGHLYALASGASLLGLPFPYSALFQVYAAICAAILYNLFAIAFTVWLIGTLLLSRRWPARTFWVMAVVVSLWEPFTMASQNHWALFHVAPVSVGVVSVLALVYVMDLSAAILLRRFGFTAVLVMRLSAIAIWHIIGRL